MIVAAGLLVLVGLGLFVAGVLTGVTTLYWACVGACVVAAVLLFLARRRMTAAVPAASPAPAAATVPAAAPAGTAAPAPAAPAAPEPVAAPAPAVDAAVAAPATAAAPAEPAAVAAAPEAAAPVPADDDLPTGRHAGVSTPDGAAATARTPAAPVEDGEPPVEEVEVTDLLLVVDLKDEVLVVDEHPRYHVAGCRHLAGRETFPLPVDEARTDGFTPCGSCRPDATLADRVRARRRADGA